MASVSPGAVLDYFPGVWIKELHMVHDAHLFILQFHTTLDWAGREK
jgi:hypothetical protein